MQVSSTAILRRTSASRADWSEEQTNLSKSSQSVLSRGANVKQSRFMSLDERSEVKLARLGKFRRVDLKKPRKSGNLGGVQKWLATEQKQEVTHWHLSPCSWNYRPKHVCSLSSYIFYDNELTLETESQMKTTNNNNVVWMIPGRLNIGNVWKSCF